MGRMLYKAVGKVQTLASRAVSLSLAQLSLQARFLGKEQGHHPGLCSVCAGLQGKATALGGSPVQHSKLQKHCVRVHAALLMEIRTVLYSGKHSTVKGATELPQQQLQQEQVDPVYTGS